MQHHTQLKARWFAFSGATGFYLILWYFAVMFLSIIICLPLQHFFPAITHILALISVLPAAVIVLLLLICEYFGSAIFGTDKITICWFGIPIRRIPISQFKLFCAVGNQGEDLLCLSCYSVEELAAQQEKRLLRSFLNKHSVPLRKQRASWQDTFAKENLNYLHQNPLSFLREPNVVMFEMHPALQHFVHQAYPFIPYKNYTEVTSHYISRFSKTKKDQALRFPLHLFNYTAKLDTYGIHLLEGYKEFSFIPADQIRTVVRIDIFKRYEKYHPHHIPLLFVTTLSEEELSSRFPTRGYRKNWKNVTADQSLLAMTAACNNALKWNRRFKGSCIIPCYEENLQALRTLYPHATVNLVSERWLKDSPAILKAE